MGAGRKKKQQSPPPPVNRPQIPRAPLRYPECCAAALLCLDSSLSINVFLLGLKVKWAVLSGTLILDFPPVSGPVLAGIRMFIILHGMEGTVRVTTLTFTAVGLCPTFCSHKQQS